MQPDLQSSLLCDDIRWEQNGKVIVIGVFDALVVPSIPVMSRFWVYNRWCCGEGEFKHRTRIIGVDGKTPIAEGKEIPIKFINSMQVASTAEVFLSVKFVHEGIHWIEVLLDGDLKMRYPLIVRVAPPQAVKRPPEGGAPM